MKDPRQTSGLRTIFCLAKRWIRSLVGYDVYVTPECWVPIVTLGQGGGAWAVCAEGLGKETVLYSFGVGRDLSFERAMIERYGLMVHAFDPTPVALTWAKSQPLPANLHLHELGIAPYDGVARFQPPTKLKFESFSMVRSTGLGQAIDAPVRRFQSLARMLGHTRVDVLKMDIEGAEYEVLTDVLQSDIPVGQILVEFHHRWKEVGAARTRQAIDALEAAGYVVAAVSSAGTEYTFIPRAGASAARSSSFLSAE